MKQHIGIVVLLAVVLSACAFVKPTGTTGELPTRPASQAATAPATTVTELAPTIIVPTPTLEPPPGFDPALYRPAMRPEFAEDVNAFGGAPRYFITLSMDPNTLQATGRERVHYTNTDATLLNEIYFRLFPSAPGFGAVMTVTAVTLDGQAIPLQLERQGTALKVPAELAPGASADLGLDFIVGIPHNPTAGYAMFGSIDGMITLPDFYPVIPVHDDSGWHIEIAPEYGDETFTPTALYDVSITAPPGEVVATSGTCQEPQSGTWHCVSGPMRDFMLAMDTDYRVVAQTVGDVTVRSFYLPSDEVGGRHALRVASDALRVYTSRFGEYPFAELDVVETGTQAGGIEYPGLVVIASSLYSGGSGDGYFDFVIAHEVAHQWWYSLVGDDQVNHPWLDESLAQYSTILYYEDTVGKSTADQLVQEVFQAPYQQLVQEKRDQKVDQPVSAFTQSDYSTVVYRKGPLFFKALREAIGDVKFDAFLKTYFRQNRYGIATPERMLDAAESVADRATVRSLFDQWIESATTP
jgi:hypothetical protein